MAFLQPKLYPLLIIATVILILFLMSFAIRDSHQRTGDCKKEIWIRAIVLSLPIVFLYAVYGQSLGTDALLKRRSHADSMTSLSMLPAKQSALKFSPDGTLTLLNVVRNLEKLNGLKIRTIGSVYRDSSIPEGSIMLFRFAIYCCAADAMPIWLLVESETSNTLRNEDWVKVEGILRLKMFNDKKIPVIEAASVRQIPAPSPEARYLYY